MLTRIAADEYGYESDSDLEEGEEEEEGEEGPKKEEELVHEGEPSLNGGLFSPAFQSVNERVRKDVSVATEPIEPSAAGPPSVGLLVPPGGSPNGPQVRTSNQRSSYTLCSIHSTHLRPSRMACMPQPRKIRLGHLLRQASRTNSILSPPAFLWTTSLSFLMLPSKRM